MASTFQVFLVNFSFSSLITKIKINSMLVVHILDSYGGVVYLSDQEFLILRVEVEEVSTSKKRSPLSHSAEVIGEKEKALINGAASFSSLRLVGLEGNYSIAIKSNSSKFDPQVFYVTFRADIQACPKGKIISNITESDFGVCIDGLFQTCSNIGKRSC